MLIQESSLAATIMSTYIYDIVLGKGNDGPAPPRSAQATVADQISYRYTFLGTYGEWSMANVEAVPRIPPPPISMEWWTEQVRTPGVVSYIWHIGSNVGVVIAHICLQML